jgi:hypothetical protein
MPFFVLSGALGSVHGASWKISAPLQFDALPDDAPAEGRQCGAAGLATRAKIATEMR